MRASLPERQESLGSVKPVPPYEFRDATNLWEVSGVMDRYGSDAGVSIACYSSGWT